MECVEKLHVWAVSHDGEFSINKLFESEEKADYWLRLRGLEEVKRQWETITIIKFAVVERWVGARRSDESVLRVFLEELESFEEVEDLKSSSKYDVRTYKLFDTREEAEAYFEAIDYPNWV